MYTTKETAHMPLPRAVEVLDFSTSPAAPDRDISDDFSRDYKWLAAEHPTAIAMVEAAREQAARAPYEQSDTFKQRAAQIRSLLADVPKATRQALAQARARFAEIDAALTATDAELARMRAARPSDLGKLDTWARESTAAGAKRDRLLELHAQAAGDVAQARTALLAALVTAAERYAVGMHRATLDAQQAVNRAQAALHAAHSADTAAAALVCRIRDQGSADPHISFVLEGI